MNKIDKAFAAISEEAIGTGVDADGNSDGSDDFDHSSATAARDITSGMEWDFTTWAEAKATLEKLIEEVIAELPGGFSYDWTMDWRSGDDDETYYTEGEGDWERIPDEEAKEDARLYELSVMEAIEEAKEEEEEVKKYLLEGDFAEAKKHLERAANKEEQFGDCPTYRLAIKALEKIIN